MNAALNDTLRLEGMGHDLLTMWAPWARDDAEDRHSWSVKPRVEKGYQGDPPDEFWIVDKIVAPHRRDRTPYWTVVSRWYLGETAMHLIVRELGWSERRVMMNLMAFGALVEREFVDFLDANRCKIRIAECGATAPARNATKPA